MNFHQHGSNNMLLGRPSGMANCETMPATMIIDDDTRQTTIASFWRPTPEELAQLNAGESVVLYVFGAFHPPVAIGVCK